jgi:hypothetical protein
MPIVDKVVLDRPKSPLEIISGDAKFTQLQRTFIHHSYVLNAETDVKIRENTFYFPGWEVIANNKNIPINFRDEKYYGAISFNLPKGLYLIDVEFKDTPIRIISGYLSGISIGSTLLFLFWYLLKDNHHFRFLKYPR